MNEHNVVELSGRETSRDELTELLREGARKLIGEAVVTRNPIPVGWRLLTSPVAGDQLGGARDYRLHVAR